MSALRVLEWPLALRSEGRRSLSSLMAFISSFWVWTRADWLLLQPEVEGRSCSVLLDSRLYASDPPGGDRLWELELWTETRVKPERRRAAEGVYRRPPHGPFVALRGFQHQAGVLAVAGAAGAAGGFPSVGLPLHPAFAFSLARVVPAGDSVHVVQVGPPLVPGQPSGPSAGRGDPPRPSPVLLMGTSGLGLAAAGFGRAQGSLLALVFLLSCCHAPSGAGAGRWIGVSITHARVG